MRWIGLVLFFLASPALVLLFVHALFENLFSTGKNLHLLSALEDDTPLILLSFYSGAVGAVCLYVYERVQMEQDSPPVVTQTAMLLFGGVLGAASFFLLRSGFVIKLLYPKLDLEGASVELLTYHSTIILAFLAGLLGPKLVARAQRIGGKRLAQKH